jgi:hypothetical protein
LCCGSALDRQANQENMMKMMIPYMAICLLVQGCVGGAVLKTRTTAIQDPIIPDMREYWPRQLEQFDMTNTVVYSAAWLEAHWGKPASITRAGADNLDEIWTYKYGVIWKGIEVIFLVPIPIALPVEREKIQFVLRDGRVVSAARHESRTVGGAYGYSIGPCGMTFAGGYAIDE